MGLCDVVKGLVMNSRTKRTIRNFERLPETQQYVMPHSVVEAYVNRAVYSNPLFVDVNKIREETHAKVIAGYKRLLEKFN